MYKVKDRQINKYKTKSVQITARDPSIEVLCPSLSPPVSVTGGENQSQLRFNTRETNVSIMRQNRLT